MTTTTDHGPSGQHTQTITGLKELCVCGEGTWTHAMPKFDIDAECSAVVHAEAVAAADWLACNTTHDEWQQVEIDEIGL